MRKMVLCLTAGFVGTRAHVFYLVPEDISEDSLTEAAWQYAVEHAEAYGIYPESHRELDEDYNEYEDEYEDQYSDSICGWWEAYDSKKHDGKACGEIVWENYYG